MDVTEFIQKSHKPSGLIEICQGLMVEKGSERLNISKEIESVNEMIKEVVEAAEAFEIGRAHV